MKRAALSLLAGALTLLQLACDARIPTQPPETGPAFAISDAAHGGEVAGFYFLPPMVPQPATTGTFMGSLSPVVRICPWVDPPGKCVDDSELVFTMTTGPGGQKLVVENGQHYQLNLDTKIPELEFVTGTLYRITVVLNGVPLGWADVQLEANGSAFKNLETMDVIGLVDGRTLPVKFRIEYGALNALDFDIAYHSNVGADPACRYNMDLYLYDRGRNLSVNLTNSPNTIDGTPSWNPQDRNLIAFASDRAQPGACAQPDVYVMDLTTGSVQRLTTEGGWKPAWSPDGSKIAFQRGWPPDCESDIPTDPCRQHDIWVMNADGSGQTQLTDVGHAPGADPYEDHDPTWNLRPGDPLSVTLARSTNADDDECVGTWDPDLPMKTCNFDIVSISLDGTWRFNHTKMPARDQTSPAWSRAGHALVFSMPPFSPCVPGFGCPVPSAPIDLFGIIPNSCGTGDFLHWVQISPPATINKEADWRPDDQEVLFTRTDDFGTSSLFTMVPQPRCQGGPPWGPAAQLVQNAAWGRYRPPM